MTRAKSVTCSISSVLGTLPNSSCRARATFALRSLIFCSFFCSAVIDYYVYDALSHNSSSLSSSETLIMRRVMRHSIRHKFVLQGEENELSHKRSFLIQLKKLVLRVCCRFWLRSSCKHLSAVRCSDPFRWHRLVSQLALFEDLA